MERVTISLKEYLLFFKSVYNNDQNFKDNKTALIKILCNKKRSFYRNSTQEIVAVKENGKIQCACVLMIHKNASDMLSIAFFEALPDCGKEVKFLLEYAHRFGAQNSCAKMVVSLDGHVNNSVALPCNKSKPSFGESYCPQYYHRYFEGFNPVKFTGFYDAVDLVRSRIAEDLPKLEKVKDSITMECADFGSGFVQTMRRYTDLNNEIFVDHKYYFRREYSEDCDLFSDMKPLLKSENLIFAKCGGKDIGFIVWYPDFNELVKVGEGASSLTFIKYKLLNQIPKTVKVVEIGVLSKYRRFGTIVLLFNAAIQRIARNTERIQSSWILDENMRSKAITQRYTKRHGKDYTAYEKDI